MAKLVRSYHYKNEPDDTCRALYAGIVVGKYDRRRVYSIVRQNGGSMVHQE